MGLILARHLKDLAIVVVAGLALFGLAATLFGLRHPLARAVARDLFEADVAAVRRAW